MGAYGLPDCLRITIGTEDEVRACVAALKEILS
jgi:histidinol-phosphate/aromatic aminotransferase/cobyric acid decarboxylase-like protein